MTHDHIDGLLYCPRGLRPFFDPCCPACSQEARDRFEMDILAAYDPEGDTCREDFDSYLATDPEPCGSEVCQ